MLALFIEFPSLQKAYTIKEDYYDCYNHDTRSAAERAMQNWLNRPPPEYERPFKKSVDAFMKWEGQILHFFEHPYTNAYVERMNGLIRMMNVQGAGYDFKTLRGKALLKHGLVGRETMIDGQGGLGHGLTRDIRVRLGVPISTLEADLDAGTF